MPDDDDRIGQQEADHQQWGEDEQDNQGQNQPAHPELQKKCSAQGQQQEQEPDGIAELPWLLVQVPEEEQAEDDGGCIEQEELQVVGHAPIAPFTRMAA